MTSKIRILFFLFPLFCHSQTFSGTVIDKVTQQPIETAAVYFDNTTIGTTTNEKGEFSIPYNDAVQSNLVISYLGYKVVIVSDYRIKKNIKIELVPTAIPLDEVYIDYDDGLTRKQKLNLFRKEFLGTSKFAKSCKIFNEDDLILKYDQRHQVLYASAKVPIKIRNKGLQYEIIYDIKDFEVVFRYVNPEADEFVTHSATYLGTTFYKDLKKANKEKTKRNREMAYKGSVQHFMRALYHKTLKQEKYEIFYDKFRVDEWSYFKIKSLQNSDFKSVKLDTKITILYDKSVQSEINLEVSEIFIDTYGNYTPIKGVYFSGAMGNQRVGDALPLGYGLQDQKK